LTPGIYTDAHNAGWRAVADAVHSKNAHLVIQLMHVGRMSHPGNTPHHRKPFAPSAIAPGVKMFTVTGMLGGPEPRVLAIEEIKATARDFSHGARRRSPPKWTGWKSTAPTAPCCNNSSRPMPKTHDFELRQFRPKTAS
jgi:2,4-dienoyl-CoA reductase-like NADH-dependent reductase (Old Yellow Enzyme family)